MTALILASGSSYRKSQLQALQLDFKSVSPDIDESAKTGEHPHDLALRLAVSKAEKVWLNHQKATVIGSDQVCAFNRRVFGKPGSVDKARQQLRMFSNNCIEFFTGLCVINNTGDPMVHVDLTVVKFRALNEQEIMRYIELEQPLDCAGSFKVESLGLSLFESVESKDPSALMGLPVIKLCEYLRLSGYQMP